jgi:hypothetical protein
LAIAATIALASALVTIAAASTDVSAAVIIVNVVVVVVVVIAAVASDLTAAYTITIALTTIAVFSLWCPAPCASHFWLIVVFTPPLASSCSRHQPDLSSL